MIAPERPDAKGAPPFAQVERIVVQRCASCHSEKPTQPGFAVAPKGLMLDTPERIVAGARQIYEQSVVTKVMPIAQPDRDERRRAAAARRVDRRRDAAVNAAIAPLSKRGSLAAGDRDSVASGTCEGYS